MPASAADASTYQRTSFGFRSEEGDWVGQGDRLWITPRFGSVTVSGDRSYLTVSASAPELSSWQATLAAPRDDVLRVGHYVDAERAPFRTGRAPGLDVFGDGRGCNEIYGEFWINQIRSDASGAIARLDARYVQHCESPDAPALRGRLLYRAAPLSYAYDSEAGDYVGDGTSHTFENATSTFDLSGDAERVAIHVEGDRENWDLVFAPAADSTLAEGVYGDAQRWPFHDAGHPGLSVFGNSRGCNTLTGSFEIVTLEFRQDGTVRRFRATFEQHCEGGEPALTGEIRIGA
jgi:hypothetical protein